MNLYINSTGLVSAAGSSSAPDFPEERIERTGDRLQAREPDYTGIIPPMQLRRMSKAVRMGIAAARAGLPDGITPQALSVGTAMGCLYDTEQFLSRMVKQEEQMLTPTAFIQSTHNTVAGQIALVLGCNGHNLTFVHRGHSFEHALLNARLYLNDHPEHVVLAGGIDELTDTSLLLMQQIGIYRKKQETPENLFPDVRKGSIAGEGAGFFAVSDRPLTPRALRLGTLHFFVARTPDEVYAQLDAFSGQIPESEIDLVLLGDSADERTHGVYEEIRKRRFAGAEMRCFKQLSGEYATASAIGLGLLVHAALTESWPDHVFDGVKDPARIVIINNYLDHYSCWYLEKAGL